jgi:hypothetical protein
MATLMDLVRSWESVAGEFRARAATSKTANGSANPESCRSMAMALEQAARDLRGVMGVPARVPPPNPDATCPTTSRTGEARHG